MVQVVENWAEVVGTVSDVIPSQRGPEWRVVVVDVSSVDNVGGWPNLVRSQVTGEQQLVVTCPAVPLQQRDVHPGRTVRGRARLAGPGQVLAHPDGFTPVADRPSGSG